MINKPPIRQVPQGQFPGRSLGDRKLDLWKEARLTAMSLRSPLRLFQRPTIEGILKIYNQLCEISGVTGTDRGRDTDETRPQR